MQALNVTLRHFGKLLYLSEPQFPLLKAGVLISALKGCGGWVN